jgi:MmyB-like transcription regulator ligand binding domain
MNYSQLGPSIVAPYALSSDGAHILTVTARRTARLPALAPRAADSGRRGPARRRRPAAHAGPAAPRSRRRWSPASASSTPSTPARPYERFVEELRENSAWFARWWEEHEISDTQRGTETLAHPSLGRLALHHAQTVPTGSP